MLSKKHMLKYQVFVFVILNTFFSSTTNVARAKANSLPKLSTSSEEVSCIQRKSSTETALTENPVSDSQEQSHRTHRRSASDSFSTMVESQEINFEHNLQSEERLHNRRVS